ncbi:histidinol-phosphate transaminase [candidate division WOR-1 bacterium RIFOXYA2_FULL_37_7]|uniref:Histidinol-phosphate aminotransferase n=1 Tax=candidate division WOR-1 bacterium RIFOXYB2_FULL_37_13 TaxID=1802579 RepID=A0A1F4SKW6_UNCSA|nr:MAG: histidinol-phosphate transaminase [candidate division WOR-1 bacterium RIFOXYA2_FULL_37_7]OGC21017.1 MAG: histidinol-phosphate transaminase [candidate division WOR-1 bacterium RIFOXYB2_FULL_37_13]
MSDNILRKVIKEIEEYKPGKNPETKDVIKLASNENPFGPSPKALKAIEEEANNLQIYPNQKATRLRQALAKKFDVNQNQIIAGNGSDDIMQIIAATFLCPQEEVIFPEKTFSVYNLVAKIFEGKIAASALKENEISLKNIASAITDKTKIIFIANPNNPTGTIFTQNEFDDFLKMVPKKTLVVIDEAYAEFVESQDYPDTIKHVRDGKKNLIILRTFSKFYGLAGLRVGYGIASEELIAPMMKVKMPFNVSRLAQAGAAAALDDLLFLEKTYQNNVAGKKFLYESLDKLGLSYKKTESNFIFVDVKQNADALFLKLIGQKIIIRPLTSFGFSEAIRVSIGNAEQNKKLISAMRKVLG